MSQLVSEASFASADNYMGNVLPFTRDPPSPVFSRLSNMSQSSSQGNFDISEEYYASSIAGINGNFLLPLLRTAIFCSYNFNYRSEPIYLKTLN